MLVKTTMTILLTLAWALSTVLLTNIDRILLHQHAQFPRENICEGLAFLTVNERVQNVCRALQ